ncbi:MAG: hypothetical protein V1846_03900 [Candidatus Komeilibacteria bacterium]
MKYVGIVLATIIFALALTWIFTGNDFFLYKAFAPKYEKTRREVFENTKSYKQGMIQELQAMEFEYIKADSSHKAALADVILRQSADFPEEEMPPSLRSFVQQLRNERLTTR